MSSQSVAVITGTSTGFGHLTARILADAGYRVYATMRDLHGRNAQPRRALEAKGIHVVELDVTSQSSVDAFATSVLADGGKVDVLINNAGTAHMGITEAFTPESVAQQFATNFFGPVRLNRAFLPTMREQKRGLILFVSSVVGRMVLPYMGVYLASKFALEGYAESLSYELQPFGIDISIVEPGAYSTNIGNAMISPDDAERAASYGESAHLFGKIGAALGEQSGDPSEVAEAILAVIQQKPGERILRTTVPAQSPVSQINAAIAPIQRDVMEAFGLEELLGKHAAGMKA